MSKLDARCRSRTWIRLRALFSLRRNFYQLTKDSDKSSKQFKEKFNHTQSNHFNYCPVPQQKHQIRYHHCCPRFHHRVVLSVASATNRARETCRARACTLTSDRARLIEMPVIDCTFYVTVPDSSFQYC